MKAYYCSAYGEPEVLELRDFPEPEAKAAEIKVKVRAIPVTVGDCRIRGFRIPPSFHFLAKVALGFKKPRKAILGRYFSGEVIAVGDKVKEFQVGDRVFGSTGKRFGAYSEYLCVSEKEAIAKIPERLNYAEAASVLWGYVTSLYFLDKSDTQKNQQILVNGASGSVGLAAVQLAKHYGFIVTGVSSTKNIDLVKSIGADIVIDYTLENFTEQGIEYDIIFDAVGNHSPDKLVKTLKNNGKLLHAVATPDVVKKIKKAIRGTDKRFVGGSKLPDKNIVSSIIKLVEQGAIKPIIDSRYSFDEMIKAHYRVDTGRKTGSVIVQL